MKLNNICEDEIPQPTATMIRNFEKLTKEHLGRVANNLNRDFPFGL
jgi:hypothetical protein